MQQVVRSLTENRPLLSAENAECLPHLGLLGYMPKSMCFKFLWPPKSFSHIPSETLVLLSCNQFGERMSEMLGDGGGGGVVPLLIITGFSYLPAAIQGISE